MKYFPFIYKKKKDKKERFEQLPLQIEYIPPPLPLREEKKEEIERGVIIIDL